VSLPFLLIEHNSIYCIDGNDLPHRSLSGAGSTRDIHLSELQEDMLGFLMTRLKESLG
jgi:hypothetical protein